MTRALLDGYRTLVSERARVLSFERDRAFAGLTASTLEDAARSLAAYFEVDGSLPPVRALLVPNRDAFDRLVADVLHVEIERPSDPRRIAQTQKADIVLLSPSAYATHSAYTYVPDDFRRMIWHELVHVVEEHLSPNIEASPLWWSEGLAVYRSDQWQHASQFHFREPVLEAVRHRQLPSFSTIQSDRSLAYSFGWTAVRFIGHERGEGAIVRVVKKMQDGDVLAALGENIVSFEERWQAWLPCS